MSRRNHYIPEFCTSQWTGDDGCLIQMWRAHGRLQLKRRSPKAVGFEYDLYTQPNAPAPVREYLEDHFLRLTDQYASDALSCLLNDNIEISDDLRSNWTRFILSLLQRHPQKIEWLLKRWSDLYQGVTIVPVTTQATGAIKMVQAVVDMPRTGGHINGMHWNTFAVQNLPVEFLTSDRPVIITNGLQREDSHIVVPLSPNKIFIAANSPRFISHIKAQAPLDIAMQINHVIVSQAYQYVYASTDYLRNFVNKRLGKGTPQLIVSEIK